MMSSAQASNDAKSVEQELLLLLARQGRRVPIPVFLAVAMIAAIAAARVPTTSWATWLVLAGAALAVRWLVLGQLPGLHRLTVERRLAIAVVLTAVHGITHGLSLAFFPYLTTAERAIQSFLLIGLSAGSVATTGGCRPVFLAYVLPTLGPLAFLWMVTPSGEEIGWINEATGAIIVLFAVVLTALAKDANRLFRESYEIRLQQVEQNKRLKTALEMAESASAAKTRFLASASHDLRQPVHTLSLFAAALEMRPLDARSREISSHINIALQVLAAQLDALLDVSKLDAGVVEANLTSVSLSQLLKRIVGEIEPIARSKGLFLVLDCPPDLQIQTDSMLFERVVRNLAGNAVKYTERGGVRIEAFRERANVVLSICDTGCGIPEDEQARVFEEFYQLANPERDRTKGLGLGLAIVRRLVDLLHIRMEMVSATDRGTSFYLLVTESADRPSPVQQPDAGASTHGMLDVLVIDDEASIREGMRMLLEAMGSRVALADSTASAKEATLAFHPDIILADVRLRDGENGIDAVAAVRSLRPGIPAILISGETGPDRLRQAEDAGLPLLHKPVAPDVLKREIARAMLAKPEQVHG